MDLGFRFGGLARHQVHRPQGKINCEGRVKGIRPWRRDAVKNKSIILTHSNPDIPIGEPYTRELSIIVLSFSMPFNRCHFFAEERW